MLLFQADDVVPAVASVAAAEHAAVEQFPTLGGAATLDTFPALRRGGAVFSSEGVVTRLLGRAARSSSGSTFLLEAGDIEQAFQNVASGSLGRPTGA